MFLYISMDLVSSASKPSFNFFVGEVVENNWGNWWGSRQLRMLTLCSVILSQIQVLVIIEYSLG